jgi:hypothetical protein
MTEPVNVNTPPLGVVSAGQLNITAMRGTVLIGHTVVTLLTTCSSVQTSKPRAVTVSVPQKSGETR